MDITSLMSTLLSGEAVNNISKKTGASATDIQSVLGSLLGNVDVADLAAGLLAGSDSGKTGKKDDGVDTGDVLGLLGKILK